MGEALVIIHLDFAATAERCSVSASDWRIVNIARTSLSTELEFGGRKTSN